MKMTKSRALSERIDNILEWAVYIVELRTPINIWDEHRGRVRHSFATGCCLHAIAFQDHWVVAASFLVEQEARRVTPVLHLRDIGRLPVRLRWRSYTNANALSSAYQWLTDPVVRLAYALEEP